MITAIRYHDISCGHRVVGHEGKCALLHGHNYRIHFTCKAAHLDSIGRVIDFSVIKSTLCEWLEENWDHKFLAWADDEQMKELMPPCGNMGVAQSVWKMMVDSIVWVPFNPTAENMASHLLKVIGPSILPGAVRLTSVVVEETRKCSAEASL